MDNLYFFNKSGLDLQRCERTNDIYGYIDILPSVLSVFFFSLNRPNYARYGTLFLHQLQNAGTEVTNILEGGAFSIRRTNKNYARSAVDLSLEQSYNRDAASATKGIVAFRNSESAIRRWALARSQTTMAVTELRNVSGFEHNQTASAQVHDHRVQKDNEHMKLIAATIKDFGDPFSSDFELQPLMNLASRKSALPNTSNYLLHILERGKEARDRFTEKWRNEPGRFLRPVERIEVENFAAESTIRKTPNLRLKLNTEGLRDAFARLFVVVAQRSTLNLPYFLSFPVTVYPMALALPDGTPVKTQKAKLLHKLEDLQMGSVDDSNTLNFTHHIFDGGLVMHSVLLTTTSGTNFGSIARNILSSVCSGGSSEVFVCFDHYGALSIKQCEREIRGTEDSLLYKRYKPNFEASGITGSEKLQLQRRTVEVFIARVEERLLCSLHQRKNCICFSCWKLLQLYL